MSDVITERTTSLDNLIEDCRQQTALFMERKPHNTQSCFELWRRALQLKDPEAWDAVHYLYLGFVRKWVRQHTTRWTAVSFDEDALVNGVFIRAFVHIGPDKFDKFSSLPRLLEYLKMCCTSEVLDARRKYNPAGMDVPLEIFSDEDGTYRAERGVDARLVLEAEAVEEAAQQQADRDRFWRVILHHLPSEADRTAMQARFVLGMMPQEIARVYPHLFADKDEVSRLIKNAMWRLKQDPELKKWFADLTG